MDIPNCTSTAHWTGNHNYSNIPYGKLDIILAIIVTFSIAMAIFRCSRRIYKHIGYTGMLVFTRLMGLLLASMAVNFIATGIWNIYHSFHMM